MDEDSGFARVQSHAELISHVLAVIPELEQKEKPEKPSDVPVISISSGFKTHPYLEGYVFIQGHGCASN